jgi:acetyltransferase-like isoleucine patch superfamily enzyme
MRMLLSSIIDRPSIAANPFSSKLRRWLVLRYRRFTKDLVKGEGIQVGRYTYGRPRIITFDPKIKLTIGQFCSIADGVTIFLGGNHRLDWVSTYPFMVFPDFWPQAKDIKGHPSSKGDVNIGNDVWIGSGATILSGVRIGDGAAVGAKSVVTKDVEPYAIVVGNPARAIRKRFDDETIRRLLEIKWWDWPVEKIGRYMHIILSDDPHQLFLEK